jgi:hypothetical protein
MSNAKPGRPKKVWPDARMAAEDAGQSRYFNPVACKHGHVGERFTSNNGCVACHYEKRGRPHLGPRVTPNLLTVLDSAQKSELRQLTNLSAKVANLRNHIQDIRSNVDRKYQELRMSLSKPQTNGEAL